MLCSLTKFDVEIHSLARGTDLRHPPPKNLKFYKVDESKLPFFSFHLKRSVSEILKEQEISLLIHLYFHQPEYARVRVKKYPFVICSCELPHPRLEDEKSGISRFRLASFLGKKLISPLFKKTLKNCDKLIVVNEGAKKYYSNFIEKEKINMIPRGVDSKFFKFTTMPKTHNILVVSRLIRRRGIDFMIEAMPKILNDFPDAKLHLVGVGPREGILKTKIDKLGLKFSVIFHGKVSPKKLVNLYKSCFVFCHLSFADGWNQPALEAMAIGRPVICTDAPHNSMVEDGKTGFLVPFGNSNVVAEKVITLFKNKMLAKKLGIRGRRKVETGHDWNKIAKEYYETFQEVIG